MKKLIVIFIISILATSCSDEEPSLKSSFSINGTDYSTPNGYIEHETESDSDPFYYYILLTNGDVNGSDCAFSNQIGQLFAFEIISTSSSELAAGVYEYDKFGIGDKAEVFNTFFMTDMVFSEGCSVDSNNVYHDLESGVLTITKNGNSYNIEYSFETLDFGTIEGSFSGVLNDVEL